MGEEKKIAGISKNVFFLGLVSFFNDFSNEMVLAVFPAFFVSVLKAGAASLGLVEGVADAAANVIKIYSGHLSDKVGKRKPFIFFGYAFSVFLRPLYLLVGTVPAVLGVRVADRLGKGLREAPRDAIISLSGDPRSRGRSFGYHRMMDTLGGILGPIVAYLILRTWPGQFQGVFVSAFVIGLFAVGSIAFVKDVVGRGAPHALALGSLAGFGRKFKVYLFGSFLLALGSVPIAILLLRTEQVGIGLSVASIPLFYAVYNLSSAVFSTYAGSLSDRLGELPMLIVGYIVLMLGYFVLLRADTVPMFIASFIVLGIFPACTDGVSRALAARLSPEADRGRAFGYFSAVTGFGALSAGVFGGLLWQHYSPVLALVVCGACVVVGLSVLVHSTIEA